MSNEAKLSKLQRLFDARAKILVQLAEIDHEVSSITGISTGSIECPDDHTIQPARRRGRPKGSRNRCANSESTEQSPETVPSAERSDCANQSNETVSAHEPNEQTQPAEEHNRDSITAGQTDEPVNRASEILGVLQFDHEYTLAEVAQLAIHDHVLDDVPIEQQVGVVNKLVKRLVKKGLLTAAQGPGVQRFFRPTS